MNAPVGGAAEEPGHRILDQGEPCRPSHEQQLVEIARFQPCYAEGLPAHVQRPIHEGAREGLELRPRESKLEVDGLAEGSMPNLPHGGARRARRRELDLELLRRRPETLEDLWLLARVHAMFTEQLLRHPLGEQAIDVVSAEERVAGGGEDLEDVPAEIEERHVERAATEVVHRDALTAPLAEAVGEGRGGGLVEDAQHLETGDPPSDLRGGSLQIVEVGRHRDDALADGLPEPGFGDLLGAPEHERADLGEGVRVSAGLDERRFAGALLHGEGQALPRPLHLLVVPAAPDQALHGEDRVLGVDGATLLRGGADQHLTAGMERHYTGHQRSLRLVLQDDGAASANSRHDGVGRPQIDPNDGHPAPPR